MSYGNEQVSRVVLYPFRRVVLLAKYVIFHEIVCEIWSIGLKSNVSRYCIKIQLILSF